MNRGFFISADDAAAAVAVVVHSDICTNKSQAEHLSWAVLQTQKRSTKLIAIALVTEYNDGWKSC